MRQLRYFGAAMRAGSFNEAARACAISQPALSEQIALLEQALDVRLFERAHGRAQPTPRARALERRLEASLAELGAALRGAQEQEHAVAGLVRIGLVHSYGGCWVLPAVQGAQAEWPRLEVALRRRTAQALTEAVLRGDVDLAVSFDPEPHADLEILPCFTEPIVALGAMGRRSRSVGLAQLAQRPLALLPSEYAMRRQLDSAFAARGMRPSVRLESDALDDLVRAARAGGMVALLNAAAALSLGVEKEAVPVSEAGLQRQACLVRSKVRLHTAAACHVWDALRDAMPQFPAPWRTRRQR